LGGLSNTGAKKPKWKGDLKLRGSRSRWVRKAGGQTGRRMQEPAMEETVVMGRHKWWGKGRGTGKGEKSFKHHGF